jgi:ferredoxin
MGAAVTEIDLGVSREALPTVAGSVSGGDAPCLYIGSPVYASHAVPPVTDFISGLPDTESACAVPFVTWGGVTSGIALYEMGKALRQKGYLVLGAAKVLALHSMMWSWKTPFGDGHPDAEDDRLIGELIEGVVEKAEKAPPPEIDLSELAYHPPEIHQAMEKRTFEAATRDFPKRVTNETLCTGCGVCEEVCPAGAISCSPRLEIGSACFFCFNCVRHCPEHAIDADLSGVKTHAPARAKKIAEEPGTRIFL